MSHEDSMIATIFGWSATTTACFFFISPFPLFQEVSKTNSVEKVPASMLICNALNCSLWIIYGMAGGGVQPWVCNMIGLSLTLVYVVWYLLYKYESIVYKLLSIFLSFLVIGILVGLGFVNLFKEDGDSFKTTCHDITYWMALIINVIMYAAPGQNLVNVFKTKDYNLIPIVTSLVGVVNSCLWFLFSITKFDAIDYSIFVPNVMGIVLFIIQIIIWVHFYNLKKKEDGETPKEQLIDSDI